MENVEDLTQKAVVVAAAYVCYTVFLLRVHKYRLGKPIPETKIEREKVRVELLRKIATDENTRGVLRMGPDAFSRLVNILRGTGRLRDNKFSCVEEQVAKFLHILAQNVTNRNVRFFFRRSGETISRHFHQVLRALVSLEDVFLIQPDGSNVPYEIVHSGGRFYPYFQNCVGAIDGTHIRVKVSRDDIARYRGRKGYPTLNVFAACTFDLIFTYVLPGWEGSASDSRILEDVLTREDKLIVPEGKFYLVDAGYPLKSGFITPFRNTRYHLKEYSSHPPENPRELFNLRHSSLRNAIERAFGVLKKRFPIIASATPQYDVDTMSEIILGCCIIHNFLMGVDPDEDLIAEVDGELTSSQLTNEVAEGNISRDEDGLRGEMLRDNIGGEMWRDYMTGR